MANPWFRMYAEFATDPKVQMMSEHLQRRLLMVMCFRCNETLETLHETELSFALRISMTELDETKKVFLAKGFIDEHWNLVNWDKRQFASDSSTARVRKHREEKKQGGLFEVTEVKRSSNGLEQNRTEQIQNIKLSPGSAVPGNPSPVTNQVRDAVERVFGFYCMKFSLDPMRYTLTPERRSRAEDRMRERLKARLGNHAAAEEDLATAVDNLSNDEYLCGKGITDWLTQLFKSTEEFEKRLNWKQPKGVSNGTRTKGDRTMDALKNRFQARRDRDGPSAVCS